MTQTKTSGIKQKETILTFSLLLDLRLHKDQILQGPGHTEKKVKTKASRPGFHGEDVSFLILGSGGTFQIKLDYLAIGKFTSQHETVAVTVTFLHKYMPL